MLSIEWILVIGSTLLILSILSTHASGRMGIPSLLIFLIIGMLAGSDGPGGIEFDYPQVAQSLGVTALIIILFAGGLDTTWRHVRPMLWRGVVLSTVGVAATASLVGWFASVTAGFSLFEGLLLGAIVSSTDAAAVFAILRARNIRLTSDLKALLELESGSNDPMAVFLTLGMIRLLTEPASSFEDLAWMFVLQMSLGTASGLAMGWGVEKLLNRARLEYEGLFPVLTLALVFLTYGLTSALGGNGFLAVYLVGLMLGRREFAHKAEIMRFHDGLAWLMQIAMFLTLGLQVFPSRLVPIFELGLVFSAFLMLVARPLSVLLALLWTRMRLRELVFVGWVGLRGAVPIILATFPLLAGVPLADHIFHLVFFIVLTSVLLQGTSLPVVARWLGLDRSG
ncbi:MAG: potassium/proton antiporter [Nitrospirales bacterium]